MTDRSFREDYDWQRQFLPHVTRLLGEALIREGTIEEDKTEATDFITVTLDAVRIGCRVRDHEFFGRYGDDITIRSWRRTGAVTELAKILGGWGDYLFYGFASETRSGRLRAARLLDLDWFRWWWQDCEGNPPCVAIKNRDAQGVIQTEGKAFSVNDMDAAAITAEWGHSARAAA